LKREVDQRLANFMAFGTSHPELLDDIINPPLLLGPYQ